MPVFRTDNWMIDLLYDYNNNNNNNPVSTIPPQRIVVWEFLGPTYGYEEIGMKCDVVNLT